MSESGEELHEIVREYVELLVGSPRSRSWVKLETIQREREREEEGVYTVREVRGFVSSAYKEYLRPSSSSHDSRLIATTIAVVRSTRI